MQREEGLGSALPFQGCTAQAPQLLLSFSMGNATSRDPVARCLYSESVTVQKLNDKYSKKSSDCWLLQLFLWDLWGKNKLVPLQVYF